MPDNLIHPGVPQQPLSLPVPITSIRIKSITFTSDHNLLNDYDYDWKDNTDPHIRPEWTSQNQHSVSHDMNKKVTLSVELVVDPANATSQLLTLKGNVNIKNNPNVKGTGLQDLIFQKSQNVSGGTITKPLVMESDNKLPQKILDFNFKIAWSAHIGPTSSTIPIFVTPIETSNRMFVTFGIPRIPNPRKDPSSPPRLGFTRIRMIEATLAASESEIISKINRQIPPVNALDPHDVALGLISRFRVDPDIDYENEWEIVNSAACYPIIRYADAVMSMLGCPGTISLHVVWAWVRTPDHPEFNTAPYPNMHFDAQNHERLQNYRTYGSPPDANKNDWLAWLDSNGRNKFEACLQLNYNNRTKLYAPGFGAFNNAREVLFQFNSMNWFNGDQKMDLIYDYKAHRTP